MSTRVEKVCDSCEQVIEEGSQSVTVSLIVQGEMGGARATFDYHDEHRPNIPWEWPVVEQPEEAVPAKNPDA